MKTNDLRELVTERLRTVCENVYYEIADDDAMYPHVVYGFSNINLNDLSRDDLMMDIDIWDKSKSAVVIENLADSIEELFRTENLPQNTILPTFFLNDRKSLTDPDKDIRHRLLRVLVQNYER